jgi:hypothetical protein
LIAIKLDRKATVVAPLDHEIDGIGSDFDLRVHAIPKVKEAGEDISLEARLAERCKIAGGRCPSRHRILEMPENFGL